MMLSLPATALINSSFGVIAERQMGSPGVVLHPSLASRPWRVAQVKLSFTVRKCGLTDNQLRDRHLCKMEQTRAFATSIMMFKEGKKSSPCNLRVDMRTIRKPGKESNKATLARIKKEMAQPRLVKSARKES
jgi:hypothetical protein